MRAVIAVLLSFILASCHPAYAVCSPARDEAGRIKRSSYQVFLFKRQYPCPATGSRTGACPGYVVDHVIPLACCGADRPYNMQWQTTAASKAKDKIELRQCGGQ